MTGASVNTTAPLATCTLFKGDSSAGTFRRTVVKTVNTRLTMPTAFRWGPEPSAPCPMPTRSKDKPVCAAVQYRNTYPDGCRPLCNIM
jgi:hypothetical protein